MNEAEASPNMEHKCPQCGAPLPSGVLAGLCPACLFKQGAAADTVVPPEATPFLPPAVEEVARLFPQLEIITLLGKGGMGAVYKARQPALDRIVALKILPPQTAGGPGFIERFNREARALARLNHPNIVGVYEFGQLNGLPFFIMEFVDGLNLRQLERAGKLSAHEALQIVPQICEALQFAHDEGIVHRDIKPENILLDKKGRVKIADFGIAKILGRAPDVAITETGGTIGTPHYMAPEQMEKPATVDHRADIFSLGVVFYEMLTGELPLGKFAPPSSRKVEVDVRLDDVVLRALEKDPERRYQHASQVKTAVDTIAGSGAPPPPIGDAAALAREILARDYTLSIRSCVRRSWKLVRNDFWPLIGVTALLLALLGFASSIGGATLRNGPAGANSMQITSVFVILVWGPLMGGLSLYYLKKIRGEPTNIEVAFSGFSRQFLHLFLAGFVTSLLTWLGFLCLILPGIYLAVAWWFTLTLVIDKRLDFWSAMELSRRVVTRHWWKLFGFWLVVVLLYALGLVVFFVGFLITAPIAMIAATYAYEDIFGQTRQTAVPPPAGAGPFGTVVMPETPPIPPTPPHHGPGAWTPATKIGLAAVALVIVLLVAMSFVHSVKRHRLMQQQAQPAAAESFAQMISQRNYQPMPPQAPPLATESVESIPAAEPAEPVEKISSPVFGPVIERQLQARQTGTNQFLNLDTEQLLTPSPELAGTLAASRPGDDENRFWEALDIPQDSCRFQYVKWLQESGADLMFAGDGKIIGFDGIFSVAHGDSSANWDDWDGLIPDQAGTAVESIDWERQATDASAHGRPMPPAPAEGGSYRSAMQLDSREPGGPLVNLLTRDQSVNWFFKTRTGRLGILQIVGFNGNPPVATIRYKLIQPAAADEASPNASATVGARNASREALDERLDAASSITDVAQKDRPLAAVATDAAKAGDVEIVKKALGQMYDRTQRDEATHEAARQLADYGLRKQAIELAKGISDYTIRNQALTELAQ